MFAERNLDAVAAIANQIMPHLAAFPVCAKAALFKLIRVHFLPDVPLQLAEAKVFVWKPMVLSSVSVPNLSSTFVNVKTDTSPRVVVMF
jgi:hypothetical protein